MARGDISLKLEELDNLKTHLRGYNASRLSKLKTAGDDPETADAGDEADESPAHGEDADALAPIEGADEPGDEASDDAGVACGGCGEQGDPGDAFCSKCGDSLTQDEGGEGDESDRERLKALAE